jgi:VanZ family protein
LTRPVSTTLWITFALFIVYGTTIPFNFSAEPGWAAKKWAHVPLNPFVAAETGRRISVPDFTQNVLLFLPFGIIGAIRLRSASRSGLTTVVVVGAAGAALSASIEALQLLTVDRVTSLSDVVANTLGALAGVIGAKVMGRQSGRWLKQLSSTGILGQPSSYSALVAAIVICVAAWQPFDATLDVGSVVAKIRALLRDPWQSGPLTDEGIAAVQYMIFAWVTASLAAELRLRRPVRIAALVGFVAAFGLEACQLIIGSRMPSLEDATVRAAAVIVGLAAWHVTRGWQRPGLWFTMLALGVACGAAIQLLTPFDLAPSYSTFGWFPFFGYYVHTTFEALSHVFELLLLYFPLGFCASLVARRPARAAVVSLGLTLAIAGVLEYAQGWFVGRYPDITDVGISVLGDMAGLLAAGYGASLFKRGFVAELQAVSIR